MIAQNDHCEIDREGPVREACAIGGDGLDPTQLTLLGRALNQVGTAVCVTDLCGNIVWVNQAYLRLTGSSKADVLGASNGLLLSDSVTCARLFQAPVIARDEPFRRERSYTRVDGSTYITDEVVTPLFDAHGVLSHFVVSMHDITSSKEALRQQRLLNNHDVLTGLACRSHLAELVPEAIAAAQRTGQTLAMLFIDLDGFKAINDGHGHHAGDLVLKAIAARLQSAVRSSDSVARFGGDEFVILLPAISRRSVARRLGNQIVKLAGEPVAIGAACHQVGASVGVACYPEDGTTFQSLLISADRAMYQAKRDGGNQVRLARTRSCSLSMPGEWP